MEGFRKEEPTKEEGRTPETRNEKIKAAEISVAERFARLAEEALNRIGKNPYFKDLEQTI